MFLQCLNFCPTYRGNSRASRGRKFQFFVFFVFCGLKLLRACLKAPALTGYVADAQSKNPSRQQWRTFCRRARCRTTPLVCTLELLQRILRQKNRRTSKLAILGNASLFTKNLFTILCPLTPAPPNQQNNGFPPDFVLKGPQTELRTLSQNCEQTLQKLRTNRIMKIWVFLKYRSQDDLTWFKKEP